VLVGAVNAAMQDRLCLEKEGRTPLTKEEEMRVSLAMALHCMVNEIL